MIIIQKMCDDMCLYILIQSLIQKNNGKNYECLLGSILLT